MKWTLCIPMATAIAQSKIALFELAEKSVNKNNYVVGKLQGKFFPYGVATDNVRHRPKYSTDKQ